VLIAERKAGAAVGSTVSVSNSSSAGWEALTRVHSHEDFARQARIHEQTAAIGPRHFRMDAEGGSYLIGGQSVRLT
jgi:hypothetical protein